MRVLCCGTRWWKDRDAIRRELSGLPPGSVVIHGDEGYDSGNRPLWGLPDTQAVRGAEKLSGQVARELGHRVEVYSPLWGRGSGSPGRQRNMKLLQQGRPDRVLAFAHELRGSPWLADLVKRAEARGVPVRFIRGGDPEAEGSPAGADDVPAHVEEAPESVLGMETDSLTETPSPAR